MRARAAALFVVLLVAGAAQGAITVSRTPASARVSVMEPPVVFAVGPVGTSVLGVNATSAVTVLAGTNQMRHVLDAQARSAVSHQLVIRFVGGDLADVRKLTVALGDVQQVSVSNGVVKQVVGDPVTLDAGGTLAIRVSGQQRSGTVPSVVLHVEAQAAGGPVLREVWRLQLV